MATNKYTNIDLSKYASGYQKSDEVKKYEQLRQQAENAVNTYGDFAYSNQDAYQSALDAILNRKQFSYDMNADALYQQYKNQSTALGKLAMQDTIGQASALTGGYSNSYAASAGSQAYQSYLNQLNERVPELMQLAMNSYNAETDRLNNNLSVLHADRSTEYGEWSDKLNRLINDRGYYTDSYNNAYTQDYSKWSDNRNYDQAQYWNEYNAGYQAERDAVADAQFQQQYNENVRQFNAQQAENKRQFDAQMAYNKEQASAKASGNTGAVSSEISGFNSRLLSEKDFKERAEVVTRGNRGNTGNGGFKLNGVTYSNYKDYIYKQLETDYSNGLMSEGTLNYLLDLYNF